MELASCGDPLNLTAVERNLLDGSWAPASGTHVVRFFGFRKMFFLHR
jgi:hypothetical protein